MKELDILAHRVLAICESRGWSLEWPARASYLYLEVSELIEAIRGKRGDPVEEAADVLFVLMSITETYFISFHEVLDAAYKKVAFLETAPPYFGEEGEE